MRFVLAGVSGFLGAARRDKLDREGHDVVRLVRGEALSASESRWDPYAGQVDRELIESADVVGTLSGAPLAHWPWTSSYKRTFTASRVATTRTLAEAIAASDRKPAFVAQNGIAGYGDRGAEVLTEDAAADADTFMAGVTREWQGAILAARGGALKPRLLVFKAVLGGPVGSGEQYFSTMSLDDWLRAATHLVENDGSQGVYNVSGPEPVTNGEFGKHLGRVLHRPAVVPVPAVAINALAGPVASELLHATRVSPARLLAEGFTCLHPTVDAQLAAALS